MMAWIKQNIIPMLSILVVVTFGYANFTKDIEANADDIKVLADRQTRYEDKLDTAIKLLERIDERTGKNK